MSTIFNDIDGALLTRLGTMSGGTAIAYENKEYTPTIGTAYLRPTLLPAETLQGSIGAAGTDMHAGIFQIDVFTKAGIGKGSAITIAETIAAHFKSMTSLVYNGVTVRCISVTERSGRVIDGWYQIPVEIRYQAFTTIR